MRAGAALVAGLVIGGAGGWLAATRMRAPAAPMPGPPVAAPMASGRAGATPPIPSASVTAPGSEATFPAGPSPSADLGLPSDAAAQSGAPAPWTPSGEPEAPLGTHAPSPVPGDSTDALLTPRSLIAPADAPAQPSLNDFDRLRARQLLLPVQGYDLRGLRDNFAEKRGTRVHEAIDMAAPRGTPVLAVDDGVVTKLFKSAAGGLTVYEFDRDSAFSYYYAHLDHYAEGLREGQAVKKGDRLGYVGTSGNAPPDTPHLHFTIFKLAPEKRWWEGTPINPYPLWALRR